MRAAAGFLPLLLLLGCDRHEPEEPSIDDPGSYRSFSSQRASGRAAFVAGLTLPLPAGARLSYPQGIDSRLMTIEGPGFTLYFDDYGSFQGQGTTTVAGAPAHLEERAGPGCRSSVWRIRLPGTTPTHRLCNGADGTSDCRRAPAQATIASFCASEAACRNMHSIVAGARFEPYPWPAVPMPDPDLRPGSPACTLPEQSAARG